MRAEANSKSASHGLALRQVHAIRADLVRLPWIEGRYAALCKMERAAEGLLQSVRNLKNEEAPAALPDANDFAGAKRA
jgi:hypothetical protein